jgi:hypothetical protein
MKASNLLVPRPTEENAKFTLTPLAAEGLWLDTAAELHFPEFPGGTPAAALY